MTDKVLQRGRWYYSQMHSALRHTRPGYYDPGVELDIDIEVSSWDDIPSLVEALEEAGYIKPRLDERLRTEDLKITHRALDIIDRLTGGGVDTKDVTA